jgi:hypothetical protein
LRAPPTPLDSPITNLRIKNYDNEFLSVYFDREPIVLNEPALTASDLELCNYVVVANGPLSGNQILPHSGRLPRYSEQCYEFGNTETLDTTTQSPTTPFVVTFDYAVNFTINQTFNEAFRNKQSQQYENLVFLISVYVSSLRL